MDAKSKVNEDSYKIPLPFIEHRFMKKVSQP